MTGEKIDSEYFQKLYSVRNEAAKQERNGMTNSDSSSVTKGSRQSNDGCESVSNDKTGANNAGGACDGLANDVAAR